MDAFNAIIPVVFMLGLGVLARKCRIISAQQNSGIKKLIFSILLPILVFNATFTMSIDARHMQIMLFMFVLQCAAMALGYLAFRRRQADYSRISPYMMTTIEGGNAFYPLYISLVGTGFTSYFVLLDIPGIFMIFLVIPVLLARETSGRATFGSMLRSIYTNPIVCALLAGIILNLTGLAGMFMNSIAAGAYQALISAATGPIAPLILFTLGHSFSIGRDNLKPMIRAFITRTVLMLLGVAAAFLIFPWIRNDMQLSIAVILFMMCPPAFALPIILEPLYQKEADGAYCSTYISLHMIFTVLVFAAIALIMH